MVLRTTLVNRNDHGHASTSSRWARLSNAPKSVARSLPMPCSCTSEIIWSNVAVHHSYFERPLHTYLMPRFLLRLPLNVTTRGFSLRANTSVDEVGVAVLSSLNLASEA